MNTATLTTIRKHAGLSRCSCSAKQLRASKPELAAKWAGVIEDNRKAIAKAVAARLS